MSIQVYSSVITYCLSSISMILLNKAFVNVFATKLNFSILLLQNLFGLILIYLMKLMGIIHFSNVSLHLIRLWFPLSIFFVGMTSTSMLSLLYVSIPLFTVFKNCGTIFIAIGEIYWFHRKFTVISFCSFLLIIIGSMVACIESNIFLKSIVGLFWTICNMLLTVSYLLYMKYLMNDSKLSSGLGYFGPLFMNTIISTPFLLLLSLINEEQNQFQLYISFLESHIIFSPE